MAALMSSRSAHEAFLYLLLFSSISLPIFALNLSDLLAPFPDFSDFADLLSSTSTAIDADLDSRSSLTLLVVPNNHFRSSDLLNRISSVNNIPDVIRYHILLQYLSMTDLRHVPLAGKLVATLYQTTGRASENFGSVNITHDPLNDVVSISSPSSNSLSNATVLSLVKDVPYNVSIFSIDSVLLPYGFDLAASEARPSPPLNITTALINGHDFNVAASLLMSSSVEAEFEKDEGGAGLTLFIPTDEAFSDVSVSANFQSLTAEKKAIVLKFHVLHSYYTLGSLESIVNPVQPTLATELMGAESFTLNISRVNGSVAINSGMVQASVTQTVFDENPVSIFGVSKVLLPREFFGKNPPDSNNPLPGEDTQAPPDIITLSPAPSPAKFREDIVSEAANWGGRRRLVIAMLLCTGCLLLL